MIPLGKQIQTSLRLISVSLTNVLYCIYDVSVTVVSRCTLYLNKILFTLKPEQKNLNNYIQNVHLTHLSRMNFSRSY